MPPSPRSLAAPLPPHHFARMRPTPSLLPLERIELALHPDVMAPVHAWLRGSVAGMLQHLQNLPASPGRGGQSGAQQGKGDLGEARGGFSPQPYHGIYRSTVEALACSSPKSPASLLFGLGNDIMAKGCHSPTPKEAEDGGGGGKPEPLEPPIRD